MLTLNLLRGSILVATALVALASPIPLSATVVSYNPLAQPDRVSPTTHEFTVKDQQRNREIPLLVYLPQKTSPAPMVLFSHGLGGSRHGGAYLGKHWAARGYVAVFLQHPGSDASVWRDKPRSERFTAMQNAASAENFLLRVKDVPAVLDQLEIWSKADRKHPLAGRLDLRQIGMSGHSFGAVTTQALAGQKFRQGNLADPRIKAALVLSPSSPRGGGDPNEAFGDVKIPWLLMTGTKDVGRIVDIDIQSRMAVYPALPPGSKYELVLHEAEHSAFADQALPGDALRRNPNHHRAVLAISTAFWDAFLRKAPAARAWLNGDGPRSVLEKDDRWQKK